ncbi:MAG: SspB family protein [Alphaproteobacteria bacterium]
MSKDLMRYDRMVEQALRQVVRQALINISNEGLPGSHHFYVTFRTAHPGVSIPAYLKERYPQEMTIVLQFQFHGLAITDKDFTVFLSFNSIQEKLCVPFEAITIFADPSVNFALQFQAPIDEMDKGAKLPSSKLPSATAAVPPSVKESSTNKVGEKTGEVVSLDKFRKK